MATDNKGITQIIWYPFCIPEPRDREPVRAAAVKVRDGNEVTLQYNRVRYTMLPALDDVVLVTSATNDPSARNGQRQVGQPHT